MPDMRENHPGQIFVVGEDIVGVKGKCYAKAGDEVLVIADHINVLIVENQRTKERIPVNVDKLKTP